MRPAVRKSTLPTYLLTYNQFTTTHMFPCSFERWVSRTRCSKWTPARRRSKRHLWHPLQSTRRWKRQSRTFSRISKQNRCSRGGSLCGSWSCSSPCGSCKDTHPPTWHKELTVYSINEDILFNLVETSWLLLVQSSESFIRSYNSKPASL